MTAPGASPTVITKTVPVTTVITKTEAVPAPQTAPAQPQQDTTMLIVAGIIAILVIALIAVLLRRK